MGVVVVVMMGSGDDCEGVTVVVIGLSVVCVVGLSVVCVVGGSAVVVISMPTRSFCGGVSIDLNRKVLALPFIATFL